MFLSTMAIGINMYIIIYIYIHTIHRYLIFYGNLTICSPDLSLYIYIYLIGTSFVQQLLSMFTRA